MAQTNSSAPNTEAAPTASVSSSGKVKPRIPLEYKELQYNYCKNPKCVNYGIPAEQTSTRGRGAKNRYTVIGTGRNASTLKCNACGEHPTIKSNKGIVEEIERISAYLNKTELTCPNEACENHHVPHGTKKAYRSFGVAKSGAVRHQCTKCKKTFSIPKPTQYCNGLVFCNT